MQFFLENDISDIYFPFIEVCMANPTSSASSEFILSSPFIEVIPEEIFFKLVSTGQKGLW